LGSGGLGSAAELALRGLPLLVGLLSGLAHRCAILLSRLDFVDDSLGLAGIRLAECPHALDA
jgi:hypothetical protein